MKKRGYQHNYSELEPKMHDFYGRKEKALKIIAILEDYFKRYSGKKTKDLICLDIGCSVGTITRTIAPNFKKMVGIDIDEKALKKARGKKDPNLTFKVDDALNLSFKDNYFDLIICNNVYEHVADPQRLMGEIHRVLKKGGACYFTATNKYMIVESDYRLPFLSWLPVFLASFYLKVTKKGNYYYERPLSYIQLKRLVSGFKKYDYTIKIIKDPNSFRVSHKGGRIASRFPLFVIKSLKFFIPQYFWILVKES